MHPEQALNKVAALCSRKEHCIEDIRQKLIKWEISEKEIEKIIQFLLSHNFINEERFASAYARDKFRFNKWGKQKISLMLRQKKISPATIQQVIAELDSDAYADTCLQLLKQKRQQSKHTDPVKLKAQLIRFALSRGFDYDTVKRCLEELKIKGDCER
ncbi:RecX family transcriptional regulator [Porphyromonadaceae bacterium OttesenSCG-928-L07]|nr:RecX family transcriptional regulator [Porphyromonadaceae bacterium OttesenSCG-928-L07]MDL2251631.1 RecX family transcriptional regulator [Odoribacter sp. OttesenSCG-928-J03]MDL2331233.1 RecX family transcriptional regulator [Odoribacter sp. OttesenSCG-928-A06]